MCLSDGDQDVGVGNENHYLLRSHVMACLCKGRRIGRLRDSWQITAGRPVQPIRVSDVQTEICVITVRDSMDDVAALPIPRRNARSRFLLANQSRSAIGRSPAPE